MTFYKDKILPYIVRFNDATSSISFLYAKKLTLVLLIFIVAVQVSIFKIKDARDAKIKKQSVELLRNISLDKSQNGKDIIQILLSLRKFYNEQVIIDNIEYTDSDKQLSFDVQSPKKQPIYKYIDNIINYSKYWRLDTVSFTNETDLEKQNLRPKKKKAKAYVPFVFHYLGIDVDGIKSKAKSNAFKNKKYNNYASVVFEIKGRN